MKSFIPHVQFILIKPPKIIHLEKMTDDKCQSPKELDFINMNASMGWKDWYSDKRMIYENPFWRYIISLIWWVKLDEIEFSL